MTTAGTTGHDHLLKTGILIDGKRFEATTGGYFDHHNPATGKLQRSVPLAGRYEIDAAVRSGRAALRLWREFHPDERRDLLMRIATLFRDRVEDLATLASLENGTPITASPMLAGGAPADWFAYYAGWADKINGETMPVFGMDAFDYTLVQPYGVIAVIIPWNAPLLSLAMKVAPALAAGNCVVLKPPELAPFTAIHFGELCLDAGIPPGVVNVVPGGPEAGQALVEHCGVDKISFTGGLATARKVMVAAARHITPVVLELGGKSANIVFADADLERAIPAAIFSGVAVLSGQGCVLPTRLLVEDSIYEAAIEQAVAVAENISVGDPFDFSTIMGPVVSAGHCARIEDVIERARSEGSGTLLTGGGRLGGSLADGYFLPPTIFGDVDNASHLAQEEIFGPVLSIIRFRGQEEAVHLANETKYGLAAYLWTTDLKRAHRTAAKLEAGYVAVNADMPVVTPNLPFGGMRQSGFGREGGKAGLEEFIRTKNVFIPLD